MLELKTSPSILTALKSIREAMNAIDRNFAETDARLKRIESGKPVRRK